ncbi:MAG TPA: sulfite exporter TauE/SafE family protein [Thermoplasmata archaeon]|nr:sulfite exporter TauE/SafE family protein [Thermoplasmata archaeon]
MLVLILALALLVIATAAGLLGSLAGLGGGVILTPVLVLFFGIPFGDAVGASAVSVLATSTTSGAAYVHERLTDLRIGNFLQIATVPGALIGATAIVLVAHTSLVPWLLIALGVVLISTVPGSLAMRHEEHPPEVAGDALSQRLHLEGNYYDRFHQRVVHYRGQNSVRALEVMFAAGIVAGLFGIGSGVLKVLALDRALRLPMKASTATSNFMIGVTAAATVGVLFAGGLVVPMLAAPIAIGTTAGAYVGSRLLPTLANRLVRWLFVVILVVLSLETIVRGALSL